MKNFIITGLSGSGKSSALKVFEDINFFCIDNMPISLVPDFFESKTYQNPNINGFAFGMDLRQKNFLENYEPVLAKLAKKNYDFEIIFLDANNEIIQKRYSQTRRMHPFAYQKKIIDGIKEERSHLANVKKSADIIIDTSNFTPHQLKSAISNIAKKYVNLSGMLISIISFGFKFGIPYDSDLMFDVRFLKNPYFIDKLKDKNGLDKEIKDYVLNDDITKKALEKYSDLLEFLIPLYEKENKSYLTIAIGCTGGKHRSVAIACEIFNFCKNKAAKINLFHRDINN